MTDSLTTKDLPPAARPASGEHYEIRKVKDGRDPIPSFTMMGNGASGPHGTSTDIIAVCSELNRGEHRVLQFFRDQYSANCKLDELNPHVVTPTKCDEFTRRIEIDLQKNYIHMNYMQILRRIKKGTYMINPTLIISAKNYLRILDMWNSLAPKESKDD